MRALRGYFCPSLLGRKAMASLLAASRKNFPAACGLHARTKPVRLGAASLARLICALWQNNPPSITACPTREFVAGEHTQAALAACFELSSVLASCWGGQELELPKSCIVRTTAKKYSGTLAPNKIPNLNFSGGCRRQRASLHFASTRRCFLPSPWRHAKSPSVASSGAADWTPYGRTNDEQRFSPLDQINEQNIGQLGLTVEPRTWHQPRLGSCAPRFEWRDLHHGRVERRVRARC
jgi:hypothetical protein